MSESDLIRRFFQRETSRDDVSLGIGDDAALLRVPPGHELVAAVDTIVEGVHFPKETAAADIGYRALAVNLSDLAAMGASPAWCTLALSIPHAESRWLSGFAEGFFSLADLHQCALVGGDTVRGPLVITVQVMGTVERGTALRRDGARVGDAIYVSRMTGEAAGGLHVIQRSVPSNADADALQHKFLRPTPQISLGRSLRGTATAAMDVSDGLLIDLQRLCSASDVGARLQLERAMLSPHVLKLFDDSDAWRFALSGGDDYELLFTAPADRKVGGVRIGQIVADTGVECIVDGAPFEPPLRGYDHFSDDGALIDD